MSDHSSFCRKDSGTLCGNLLALADTMEKQENRLGILIQTVSDGEGESLQKKR